MIRQGQRERIRTRVEVGQGQHPVNCLIATPSGARVSDA
jgi:hypothetical protein